MAGNPLFSSDELPFVSGVGDRIPIFEDALDQIDYTSTMTNTAPMPDLTLVKNSRRPPLDAISSNTILKPHATHQFLSSPSKMKSPSQPRIPLGLSHANTKLNKVPMPPPGQAPQTDSLKKQPFMSNFKTRPKKTCLGGTTQFRAQAPAFSAAPMHSPCAETSTVNNTNGKRELLEPAPLRATESPDEAKAKQDVLFVPRWDSFPPIIDDGSKPNHSYAQLIAMAILRSPTGKLTLSSIYKWISDNFSYYNPSDPGWQNSIRHNLSLHKSFRKIVRPKSDPGKGNYWAIEPGAEQQFLKEKPKGKTTPSGENLPVMSTRLEPSMPASAPTSEPTLPPPAPAIHGTHQTPSFQLMPSSDATIPEPDNPLTEELAENPQTDLDPIFDTVAFSPTPRGVGSSPPIPRQDRPSNGTPTAGRHVSRPRPKKAPESGVDDSGYISSLDSSAIRPSNGSKGWTSSSTRPRKKRKNSESGRAEVEIARLRNSSPFSPTKSRSKSAFQPVSSSPLRQAMPAMNPLTPLVKMKPPAAAPPSVSPNTNLRNHRQAVQSMLETHASRLLAEDEAQPWSPKFSIEDRALMRDADLWPSGGHGLWVFDDNSPGDANAYSDNFDGYPF